MNHKPITIETIAAAERLAGVDYGAAERAQVLAKIDEQINQAQEKRDRLQAEIVELEKNKGGLNP